MQRKNEKVDVKRSIFILLLLAVFLIFTTYAWFTSNRLVKVDTIEVSVATSAGFQISVDAVNWKTFITPHDILGNESLGGSNLWSSHENHIPSGENMKPVSTIGAIDSATSRMEMFRGKVESEESTGILVLDALESPDVKANIDYIAFDIFLRTTQTVDLYLDTTSNVIGGLNATGLTKGLENATRVAFVNQGNVPLATYEAAGGVEAARDLDDATSVTIWEPNSNSHTTASIADAMNAYIESLTQTEKITQYNAVKEEIGVSPDTPIPLEAAKVKGTPIAAPYNSYFGRVRTRRNRFSRCKST